MDYLKLISKLSSIRSSDRDTCLVSLYVPRNYAISDLIREISDEITRAANIRSLTTRERVNNALKSVLDYLRIQSQRKSPPFGFAIFANAKGVIAQVNFPKNRPNLKKVFVVDSFFYTDLLYEPKYGLLVLDENNATIALFKGGQFEIIKTIRGIQNYHTKRAIIEDFHQLNEEEIRFLTRVAQDVKEAFIKRFRTVENVLVEGIVIGGLGSFKINFLKENFLDARLNERVLKIVDICYSADEVGVKELIERSQDVLYKFDNFLYKFDNY
ncbi:MAG: hypothetical protein ACFFC7_02220 [Candidatus Hermodarchaeota archaeon]